MSPRRYTVDPAKGVMHVEWPFFGELSRALALKVAKDWDPEIIVGVATAGVVPGAERETPAVLGNAPPAVRGKRVLIVDETCDTGSTMRLAIASIVNAGAKDVRTAVSFKTGPFEVDYYALATESVIVLPWDREVLVDGELVANPKYHDFGE